MSVCSSCFKTVKFNKQVWDPTVDENSHWIFLRSFLYSACALISQNNPSTPQEEDSPNATQRTNTALVHITFPQLMIPRPVTGTAQPHVGSLTQRESPPWLCWDSGLSPHLCSTAGREANTSIVSTRSKWILKSSVPRQPLRLQA